MRRLRGYMFGMVLGAVCTAWLILLGLYTLAEFLQQAEVPQAQWEANSMLRYLLLHLPEAALETLPYAALLGCLFRVGALLHTGELTALRVAGLGPAGIAGLVLYPVFGLSLAGLALAQFVVPHGNAGAEALRESVRNAVPVQSLWHREGGDYLYFRAAASGASLRDFVHYRLDAQHRLRGVLRAERADYDFERGGWNLQQVHDIRITGQDLEQTRSQDLAWGAGTLRPEALRLLLLPPPQLSLDQRWRHAHWLQDSGVDATRHLLRFWRDLLQPLSTAGLALLGLAFLFGALGGESAGMRIGVGVLGCFLFAFVSETASSAALVYSLSPFCVALLPPVLLFGLGAWLLRRA